MGRLISLIISLPSVKGASNCLHVAVVSRPNDQDGRIFIYQLIYYKRQLLDEYLYSASTMQFFANYFTFIPIHIKI